MSRWNDQYVSHAFNSTWVAVKTLLNDEGLEINENENAIKEIARLKKVMVYVDSILDQVDPELMPTPSLNALNQHATTCMNELNAFKGNQNIGHLTNANNNIDQVIMQISQTPFILMGQQKGALSKAAAIYAETIDDHLERLKKNVDGIVGSLKGDVSVIEEGITEANNTLTSLESELKIVAQTVEKQTSEFNTLFQTAEKSRADKFEQVSSKLQDKADVEFKRLASKAGISIEVLAKYQDDAAKVFGVVNNTLQAGAYSSYANEERKTANWLRFMAFILMIAGVGILLVPELMRMWSDITTYVLEWKSVLGRSFFALILFIPGFYLARESSRHRNNEIINRRRELILSTIDPYLALLDAEKADSIKAEIAKSIFSEGALPLDQSTDDTGNLIAQITNLVKQAHKSGK